jgi:hypothetical protein
MTSPSMLFSSISIFQNKSKSILKTHVIFIIWDFVFGTSKKKVGRRNLLAAFTGVLRSQKRPFLRKSIVLYF